MKVKNFLKGKGAVYSFMAGALVVLLLLGGLPACAPAVEEEGPAVGETAYDKYVASLSEGEYPVPRECFEQAQEEGKLNLYDWAEWWPQEMYTNFEKEFGIKIVRDNYASEPEVVGKFKLNPEMHYDMINDVGYRTVFQLIQLDVLQELNYDWLPNVSKYIGKEFMNYPQDPGAKHTVLFGYNFDAFWYNTNHVDDPRMPSWGVLLEPEEKYKGRITLGDDMFRVVADALAYLGYPIDSDDEAELAEVGDLMMKLKPYIMAFDTWPKRLMLEEEVWLAGGSYAEGFMLHSENKAIMAEAPLEPSRLASECCAIPAGAEHVAAAHLWLNYVCRPRVTALLNGTTGMWPCNQASLEFLPEDMREWWSQVPEGYAEGCREINARALTGKGLELRTQIWEELRS